MTTRSTTMTGQSWRSISGSSNSYKRPTKMIPDFLMNVLGIIGELCTLTVLESKTFWYDLREFEQSLWKYHQKISRSQLSNDSINNHGLIIYTKGARGQNTFSWFERPRSISNTSNSYERPIKMIPVVDFLMNVLWTIGELCTLTVLESNIF
jgi:hypothetical protein